MRFTIRYATKLISSMLCRLYLVFLLLSIASASLAEQASWNCQQDQGSKEWVCLGDKTSGATTTPSEPAYIKSPEPTPSKPAENVWIAPRQAPPPVVTETTVSPPSVPTAPEKQLPATVKPSSGQAKYPIKSCGNDANSDNSNCKRDTYDATADEANGLGIRLLSPAFDHKQEQVFRTLAGQFKNDPWQNCMLESGAQPYAPSASSLRENQPLDVTSNYSEIFDNEIGSYFGNVEMSRGDQHSSSNTAHYDSVSETLDLHGDVYYSEDELALHSDSATLNLASDQARIRDTSFISPAMPIRGSANVVYRDSKYLSRYKGVTFTTCRPGNQDWAIHASELKLNKTTGKGSAKNAWLEFKGVPVFYSPYMAFPVDKRRLSGFLAPAYHYTQNSGLNFSVPYYWNIAPNYDATLLPRYYTKRGAMLAGNFRYLTEKSKGIANIEYMPDDSLLNKARYLGSLKNITQFTPNISSNLDLNYVSDKNYFAELGNALSFPNFSFVRSTADVNYAREGVSLVTRVENYQTIDSRLTGIQIPYTKLPQINLNLNHSFNFMPLDVAMESESIYFQHSTLVNGQRLNLKPSVSFPLQTASSFVTPKISLQHTQYFLNNEAPGQQVDISRTLPILSLDSGLYLEREHNIAHTTMLHTVEPRLFYLYIPKTDQSNIPLFDSSLYDFWYSSLFRENRFSGSDRIQDANQLSAAITTRLLDPTTGRERLKLNLGQIVYFRNRDVTLNLPFSPVETNTLSPLVAELSSQITDHILVDSGLQWDPHLNDFVRGKAAVHFISPHGQILNMGYLYRKNPLVPDRSNDIIQSDMSFRWPVYDNWFAVGRWQYSLLYNTTQDSFVGLEKENCCWRFRVIGRRYINSIINSNSISQTGTINNNLAVDGTPQTGIFFQIEFKGLTGIGEKLDEFFEQSIYGYRKPQQ